jgi:hypothetical protein
VLPDDNQAINVLYGDPSSSFSPLFFVISAPSFVPSSGASSTFHRVCMRQALRRARVDKGNGRDGNPLAEKD